MNPSIINLSALPDPHCYAMQELPAASAERALVRLLLDERHVNGAAGDAREEREIASSTPLRQHLSYGLAYTTGSALGCVPPSTDACLEAFLAPNKVGLTAGARAWSKHFHRSMPPEGGGGGNADSETPGSTRDASERDKRTVYVEATSSTGWWWGVASGSVATINEKALALFWKVMDGATWRNLHWLPREVLIYEVRTAEGYGMRWSQDRGADDRETEGRPWTFRGFVEPMMENGHEVGWRH